MKKALSITLFVLAFGLSAFAQNTCTRHIEAAGGFSFCPPAGWTVSERTGQKFKVVMGPASDVFTPNLNAQATDSIADLSAYADAAVKMVLESADKIGAKSIAFVSRSEFITDSKEKAIKVTYRTDYKGLMIFSAQYVIETGKGKVIVTGTTLESEKGVNEKLFDAAMKTFKIEKLTVVGKGDE